MSIPGEGRQSLEEMTGMKFPLTHAAELPNDEKRLAVRGALDLMSVLDDEFWGKVDEMVKAGEISADAGDRLWKIVCGMTGTMMDYVERVVGFEGNHGPDLYTDEEWKALNQS